MAKRRPLVLIVDDEPDMCWVLTHLLGEDDYELKVAQTGEAALKLIESDRFDIALLDVKLTDMDGLDLAGKMKALDGEVHIVMMSGYYYTDDMDIRDALDNGLITAFISKPFVHKEVMEIIGKIDCNTRR
ncbi:MAG: response regulator [Desulfomonilaceae bacterium]|nr:response regulator [Desulfomonilaceae bacterium]